ncbi:Uncharacterised protein [Mycobacterium tuberculosis]|uniref:Uncharacterized protein n=1 Tax=Mycobacterium tuberculosis TaxID=1773 RepID=A0A0U0S4R2_MYCTX|nr:Uncharacterised protein [Mycobacterium tuberculosis]
MVLVGVAERFVGGQGQVAGAGVAVFGLFGHAAGDHRVKGFGDARADGAGLGDGQAFVQHAGQRVDVGAVGYLVVGEPFGGHVFPGAHRGA